MNEPNEVALTDTGAKNRSRYQRDSKTAPAVKLQQRDLAILEACFRFRYVSTEGLLCLFAPGGVGDKAVRRRLMMLFQNGYVARRYLFDDQHRFGHGSPQAIYILDRAGGDALRKAKMLPPGAMPSVRRRVRVGAREIAHATRISEFQLALELATARTPNLRLVYFASDRESKAHRVRVQTYRYQVAAQKPPVPLGGMQTHTLWPDGSFLVERERDSGFLEQHFFFLEVDRADRQRQRLFDRALAYQQYTTKYQHQLIKARGLTEKPAPHISVVFTAPTMERVATLIKISNEVPEVRRNRPSFWFIPYDHLHLDRVDRLLRDDIAFGLGGKPALLLAP